MSNDVDPSTMPARSLRDVEADFEAAVAASKQAQNDGLRSFWVSWYSPAALGGWELGSPWWVSGYALTLTEDVPTICASVHAKDEADAVNLVTAAYDRTPDAIEWRFVTEQPTGWSPYNDRFPRADWMPDWPPRSAS